MVPSPLRITFDEAREAMLRSGYLLESRVESVLISEGYYVEANASYQDPVTSKSREFDIFALTAEKAGPGEYDYLFPVVLVECVNNPQPLALLTKKPIVPFLHHQQVKVSGLPVRFPAKGDADDWIAYSEYLGYEHFHHYCNGRVATQYCSFQKKKEKDGAWMAWHDDEHFECFRKLCDVVDQHQARHFDDWHFNGEEPLNIQVYYPVLVLQGQLWDARPGRKGVTLRRARHLQFRRSVAIPGGERQYQIDVIEERYLRTLLRTIHEETGKAARLLRRRHKAVRAAIERITTKAKEAKTPAERRSAMEL
jgi:hypothetical protein